MEEIERLTAATAKLVNMFKDPWEELTFRYVGNQGRVYNAIEDRYLLCLTHLHGLVLLSLHACIHSFDIYTSISTYYVCVLCRVCRYGNWDRVRASIRKCERFRFDYYLLSCSADTLGKRCEALMRVAERELTEIDKKQASSDSSHLINASNSSLQQSSKFLSNATGERSSDRMQEILKQIDEEARRLAVTRIELQRAKKLAPADMLTERESKDGNSAPKSEKSTVAPLPPEGPGSRSFVHKTVSEELVPDLCRYEVV